MTGADVRVGELRPNQLLHTFGVGSVADLPNLSVLVLGLEEWRLDNASLLTEERLLAACRDVLGSQVAALRTPPYVPEERDPFAQWTRVGVPVGLFPRWLRCPHARCNRLAPVSSGLFELVRDAYHPEKVRYVHGCRGRGGRRPVAVPARFLLACPSGHLDDFPWIEYVHRGDRPCPEPTLRLRERGTSGEAANLYVECSCDRSRSMAEAFGAAGERNLPSCRGRHPHLGTFSECDQVTRTLTLGATNSWFPLQLRVLSIPRSTQPLDQLVADHWAQLRLVASLDRSDALPLLQQFGCWPELSPYGGAGVWEAIQRYRHAGDDSGPDPLDVERPEWEAFTDRDAPAGEDFRTQREPVPVAGRGWLREVVLVPRLREVAALVGFSRIDAPEWGTIDPTGDRQAPLTREAPTWLPCAEVRGEGIFLRFDEERLAAWEGAAEVHERADGLRVGHRLWRGQRGLPPDDGWPGMRYILLHSFAHALIREFALECGYSAAGIRERVYARGDEAPMAGILLYTAAPDSEGTLGGLVSLGSQDRLGALIEQALEAARLCSSDPLCSEHDPGVTARLYGAACHACLFAAETSCDRGTTTWTAPSSPTPSVAPRPASSGDILVSAPARHPSAADAGRDKVIVTSAFSGAFATARCARGGPAPGSPTAERPRAAGCPGAGPSTCIPRAVAGRGRTPCR